MKLKPRRGRRATAAVTGVLVGAMALTACDWTRVTELESEGWRVLDNGGGSMTLEISSRRPSHQASELQLLSSFMNRGGALRFQVGEGRADYVQEEPGIASTSDIQTIMYTAGVRENSESDVLPTLEIDVVDGDTTRTLVLDAPAALDDVYVSLAVPAVPDVARTQWEQVVVDRFERVWRYDDAEPGSAMVSLDDLAGMTIAEGPGHGLHIIVEDYHGLEVTTPADGFDGYVDGLFVDLSDPETSELDQTVGWDFEVPSTQVPVTPADLHGWTTSATGVSFVDGPISSEELAYELPDQDHDSVKFAGTETYELIGTAQYDGTPLAAIGSLRYRTYLPGESCALPAMSIGVEYTPEVIELVDGPVQPEQTVLLGHLCSGFQVARAAEVSASSEPVDGTGVWVDVDAATFTYLDPNGGWTDLDGFLDAHPDARVTSITADDEVMPEGGPASLPGIALHGGTAIWQFLAGGPVVSVDEAPVAPAMYVSDFALGQIGDTRTTTYDFGPARSSGGGGVAGYTVTVPAGGGTGTIGLPGGTGSITTSGNAGHGSFWLVPGGVPTGTPDNFRVVGASWNITPLSEFEFDTAEVCLPYDGAALKAAGFDEDDVALVHYAADGTLEDITTSLDVEQDIVCGETDSFSPFAIGILDVDRLAGRDRIATAAAISAATFEPGAPVAYIATSDHFADALAGGAAAAQQDGPVLLADRTAIPAATLAELARLRPAEIVVLGGTAAISDAVLDGLGEMTDGAVTRLAGTDRYGTAAAVSAATFGVDADVVYVATGQHFADALTGGAVAARDGAPVLLVSSTSIPTTVAAELQRLSPDAIVVLGGPAAISDDVVEALEAYAPVDRLSGTDRYETAAAIAETFTSPATSVFVASGRTFPDALTGVPAAGRTGSPILLVDGSVPASADREVQRLDPGSVRILGGTDAIAEELVTLLRDSMLN